MIAEKRQLFLFFFLSVHDMAPGKRPVSTRQGLWLASFSLCSSKGFALHTTAATVTAKHQAQPQVC